MLASSWLNCSSRRTRASVSKCTRRTNSIALIRFVPPSGRTRPVCSTVCSTSITRSLGAGGAVAFADGDAEALEEEEDDACPEADEEVEVEVLLDALLLGFSSPSPKKLRSAPASDAAGGFTTRSTASTWYVPIGCAVMVVFITVSTLPSWLLCLSSWSSCAMPLRCTRNSLPLSSCGRRWRASGA